MGENEKPSFKTAILSVKWWQGAILLSLMIGLALAGGWAAGQGAKVNIDLVIRLEARIEFLEAQVELLNGTINIPVNSSLSGLQKEVTDIVCLIDSYAVLQNATTGGLTSYSTNHSDIVRQAGLHQGLTWIRHGHYIFEGEVPVTLNDTIFVGSGTSTIIDQRSTATQSVFHFYGTQTTRIQNVGLYNMMIYHHNQSIVPAVFIQNVDCSHFEYLFIRQPDYKHSSEYDEIGGSGIRWENSSMLWVCFNDFRNLNDSAIECSTDSPPAGKQGGGSDCMVMYNTIDKLPGGDIYHSTDDEGIELLSSNRSIVVGNIIKYASSTSIDIGPYGIAEGNQITFRGTYGLDASSSVDSNGTFRGNKIYGEGAGSYGMNFAYADNIIAEENQIYSCKIVGIQVGSGAENISIKNNDIFDTPTGIVVAPTAYYPSITGNRFVGCTYAINYSLSAMPILHDNIGDSQTICVLPFWNTPSTGQTGVINRTWLQPMLIPKAGNITELAFNIATLSAGQNMKLSIWADNNKSPYGGALLYESANISTAATGAFQVNITNVWVTGQVVWVGVTTSDATMAFTRASATSMFPSTSAYKMWDGCVFTSTSWDLPSTCPSVSQNVSSRPVIVATLKTMVD
jgi:hypothetical protein